MYIDVHCHLTGDEFENVGGMDGAEVLQVYVSGKHCYIARPVKELKGYQKVFVAKGETVAFDILLDKESFSFYNAAMEYDRHDSDYTISLAVSAANTWKTFEIAVKNKEIIELLERKGT